MDMEHRETGLPVEDNNYCPILQPLDEEVKEYISESEIRPMDLVLGSQQPQRLIHETLRQEIQRLNLQLTNQEIPTGQDDLRRENIYQQILQFLHRHNGRFLRRCYSIRNVVGIDIDDVNSIYYYEVSNRRAVLHMPSIVLGVVREERRRTREDRPRLLLRGSPEERRQRSRRRQQLIIAGIPQESNVTVHDGNDDGDNRNDNNRNI